MVEQEDLKALNLDSPVFADFDNDAAIDKAFWDNTEQGIKVFYNSRGSNSASSGSL